VSGIRTVIVTTPAILRDLIEHLTLGKVELDIVAELADRRALSHQLGQLQPELVVIGLRANESDTLVRRLITLVPTARFIAFSDNGRNASGFELRFFQTDLSDVPPSGLVDFIRGCAPPGGPAGEGI
jgi:DNA-binding NarL/FixJ family response regulator